MGLSQEELAEEIFLSRQSISNWEWGSNYPDLDSLVGTVRLNVMVLTQSRTVQEGTPNRNL